MPAAEELEKEGEAEQVLRWRTRYLERAGFDATSARALAEKPEVDVHFAADLLQRGCPSDTALRILL